MHIQSAAYTEKEERGFLPPIFLFSFLSLILFTLRLSLLSALFCLQLTEEI